MGDRGDCGGARTEGSLHEAGPLRHHHRVTKEESLSKIPETAFPEPYLLTETENKIIDDIRALLDKHGLTTHQSKVLIERLDGIIEMGQRLAKGTTH